jgi:hypothetical protein
MIHKVNDFYCVNLETINKLQKLPNEINHTIVIDNANLEKDYLNEIINAYPQILSHYDKMVNIKSINLITTYPKLKKTLVTIDNVYSEFRKIMHNKNSIIFETDTIDECINCINVDIENEFVIFNKFPHWFKQEMKEKLNKLKEHVLSIMVSSNDNNNDENMYVLASVEEYKNFLNSKIFIKYYNNKPQKININIFGTECNIMNDLYDYVPILNKIDSIVINDDYPLLFSYADLDGKNILDMIECALCNGETFDNNIILYKQLLLNVQLNTEIKNKITVLHRKYKNIYEKFMKETICNLNDNTNENMNEIIEYGKKTNVTNTKKFIIPIINKINVEKFIKVHESNTTNEFNNSLELFESTITLSNWFDEIKNNCSMGLIFTFQSSNLTKKGVHGFGMICDMTMTFMSLIDFINNATEYFKKSENCFGDLNEQI